MVEALASESGVNHDEDFTGDTAQDTNRNGSTPRILKTDAEREEIGFRASIWVIHQQDPDSVVLAQLRARGLPVDEIIQEHSTAAGPPLATLNRCDS